MATEYMYLNGGVSKATLILEHCKTGKVKTKKLTNNNITPLNYRTLYWNRVVVVSEYEEELDRSINSSLHKYVAWKYKGKYKLVKWENVEYEEDNHHMANAPLKECVRLMTPEQFINQFGEEVIKGEIVKEFVKWMRRESDGSNVK